MVKEFRIKLTNKGVAILFQIGRGMSNTQISKILGIPVSRIRYYRKRPNNLICKRSSKLPKKYINEIYKLTSKRAIREMHADLIAITINEKMKKKMH